MWLRFGPSGFQLISRIIYFFSKLDQSDKKDKEDNEQKNYFKFRLQLLLATVAPIPRAVQYTVSEIASFSSSSSDLSLLTSPETLKKIYSNAENKINVKYSSIRGYTISSDKMRVILFENEVPLDNEITKLVQKSLLVSSLDIIAVDSSIVPKTSVLLM